MTVYCKLLNQRQPLPHRAWYVIDCHLHSLLAFNSFYFMKFYLLFFIFNFLVCFTRGNETTSFVDSLPLWIKESDFVILVGSTSFPLRAKDPSTLTFRESTAIGEKKAVNSNSIIPVLFAGRFGSSFPPGYQDTIGGRFTKTSEYLKEMPGVVASILGVSSNPEITTLLASYTKEAEAAIIKASTMTAKQIEEVNANLETQRQYWASHSLVLLSKFTLDQMRQIDGMVNIRTKRMDDYCNNFLHIPSMLFCFKIDIFMFVSLPSLYILFIYHTTQTLLHCLKLVI